MNALPFAFAYPAILGALVALFLGFEAPAFRRDWLLFRGYQWRGDVISSAEDLAQRDYLSARQ